jgi:hypothetical protein
MRFRTLASIAAILASAAPAAGAMLARPAIADERPALAVGRAPAAHAERDARCSIALEPDRTVSATVVDTPLDEVIAELARRTGTKVRWTEAPSATHVTLSFHGLPLIAAVDHLLADHNYIVILTRDGDGRARAEVRIGSAIEPSDRGTGRASPPAAPARAVEPAGASVAGGEPAQGPSATPEDRGGLETVAHFVGLEHDSADDSPLRDALKRALAEGDAPGVARATSLGMGALSDELLERAARASDVLRPIALELLARRAAGETPDEDGGGDALR